MYQSGLNYTKGHALLRMLEAYVGHDVWQEAIRKYIERDAWNNATEQDLRAAVSEVSDLDIAAIAGAYLNQPGFALVNIDSDRFYALVDDANSLGDRERIALLDNSRALFSIVSSTQKSYAAYDNSTRAWPRSSGTCRSVCTSQN